MSVATGTGQRLPHSQTPREPVRVKGLILDLSKRYGGASTRTITLASGMRDWQLAIVALSGSPVAEAAIQNDIPVVKVGKHRIDPRIPFRIASAYRSGEYQLVDTQNIQSKIWGSLAAVLTGAALVSTLNSSYAQEHGGSLKGRIYSILDRMTNWRVDRYIAVSNSIKTALRANGISEDSIDLIRNAIAIERTSSRLEPAQLRSGLGLPTDAIICVAVGRLVWAKGYVDLIKAFAKIAPGMIKVYCVIVGEGPLHAELQEQIDQAGLSGRMLLAGYRNHESVLEILRSSDIFVMSSRSEGIPYALLEAGALGLPILATRCGGIPEVVRDGKEAILVDPADIAGLAASLTALCNDSRLAKDLGASAMRRIRKDFSVTEEIKATKDAYLRALRKRTVEKKS
jgi:glycosyltransferase involved in cell wall biosynthesis